jgi:hypothetical protein
MESINKITKYGVSILLLILVQSCWTSENDTMEVDNLVGSFKVIYNQNDTKAGHILSLNSQQGSYQYIEKRCEEVYFDSTEIFVKYTWHDADTTHHYSRVKIQTNEKVPYQKQELSYKDFYKRVESCKDCLEKKYKP